MPARSFHTPLSGLSRKLGSPPTPRPSITFASRLGRTFATVKNGTPTARAIGKEADELTENSDDRGPIKEYDDRVAAGRLRDDDHQRGEQCKL